MTITKILLSQTFTDLHLENFAVSAKINTQYNNLTVLQIVSINFVLDVCIDILHINLMLWKKSYVRKRAVLR